MIKKCKKCDIEFKCRDNRTKYCSDSCKDYKNAEYFTKYRLNNREKIKKVVSESTKKWYNNGGKDIRKKYQEENKEVIKSYNNERYESIDKERLSKYYQKNIDQIKKKRQEYRKTEEYKLKRKEYNDRISYRNRYRYMLKGYFDRVRLNKNNSTCDILGYTDIEFKLQIESMFLEDMSWTSKNFQIDHIVPICAFIDGTDPKIVNSLENLRPIYGIENKKKFNNIDFDFIELYVKYYDYLTDKYKDKIDML